MSPATAELADRWARARRAALREVLAISPDEAAGETEATLQDRALATDEAETCRRLFENGVTLGRGYQRVHGGPIPFAALPDVLAALEVPCARGAAQRADGDGLTVSRAGCAAAAAGRCDAWREAIDGLVVGLSDGARLARFESLGHGDPRCVDFLYEDPQCARRFGPVSDALRALEVTVRQRLRKLDASTRFQFLGVSEGVLAFELEPSTPRAVGTLTLAVEQALRVFDPRLTARRWLARSPLSSPSTGCTESP